MFIADLNDCLCWLVQRGRLTLVFKKTVHDTQPSAPAQFFNISLSTSVFSNGFPPNLNFAIQHRVFTLTFIQCALVHERFPCGELTATHAKNLFPCNQWNCRTGFLFFSCTAWTSCSAGAITTQWLHWKEIRFESYLWIQHTAGFGHREITGRKILPPWTLVCDCCPARCMACLCCRNVMVSGFPEAAMDSSEGMLLRFLYWSHKFPFACTYSLTLPEVCHLQAFSELLLKWIWHLVPLL